MEVVARTDNSKIKGNKKRRALRGNQRVVLLMNSVALTNSCASNPFFFFTSLIPSSYSA